MVHAMASMAGLGSASGAVLEGGRLLSSSSRLTGARSSSGIPVGRSTIAPIRAQQAPVESEAGGQSSRRALLSILVAGVAAGSFVKSSLAEGRSILLGPPPPPSGGLPGTLNSDEPRDLKLSYKDRFYLQPLTPVEAAKRVKESAKDILSVKGLIDKKAWPYVMSDLRLKASYLRYDLNTVISSKQKEEKKTLKELTGKLFSTIDGLDHAAKIKSTPEAEKYYAETVATLNGVLAKLG